MCVIMVRPHQNKTQISTNYRGIDRPLVQTSDNANDVKHSYYPAGRRAGERASVSVEDCHNWMSDILLWTSRNLHSHTPNA